MNISKLAARAAILVLPLFAAACGTTMQRPPIPPGIDDAHLHFTDPEVSAGDTAPDFTLPRAGEVGEVTLSEMRGRPVVLVFGSFT